jgi:transglutaminase-like putative cysteine protease
MSAGHRFCIPALAQFLAVVGGVLAAALMTTDLAWAGIGFQPVNPEELKMTSEPLAPGAAAIILYRQVDRDDDRHTPHEDNYLRVKILTEEGRKYADVEIVFSKGFEDISNLRARTIKPDGSIVNFDGKVFEKTIVKSRGRAYLAKTFTLPDVEVGGIIEYYYTIDFKEYYVFESHWILSQELFTKDAKFSLKPYSSSYNEFHLRWSWHLLPPGAEPKEGPRGIVEMEVHNIPAFQEEDFTPPENELKARVDFVYDPETLELDSDKYWRNVGKKRNGALESFIGKPKVMAEAVGQIVSPNDAPEVKLRKIYGRVQQIRNTSYEIRKTEQEEKRDKEKVAENVEDVWKRGYGNGVQLTWLFLGLARAAGFEAYGCWVANRRQYFFNPKQEKSGELDANVVLVKLNGKDLYFDPGGEFTPFGLLTWSETGVVGLKLDKDDGSWIQTTLPQASESQIRREAKLKLSDAGDLEGELTVTYTGLEAMYHRLRERHEDETARKKHLEDSLKEQIPAAAELELTNKPDWTSAEAPLVAVLNVKIPGWVSSAGKRALLPVGFFTAHEKHIFEHANRVYPIYFEYPYEKLDDVTIELPQGWQVSSVPPPQTQDGHIVMYTLKVEDNNSSVRVSRKLTVDILLLESKYYTALRNFFQVVRTGDEQQILLQPAATSASN